MQLSLLLKINLAYPGSFSATVQHCMLCETDLIQANSCTLLSIIGKVCVLVRDVYWCHSTRNNIFKCTQYCANYRDYFL